MRNIVLISAVLAMASVASAQPGPNHAAHHPDGASAPVAAKKASSAKRPGTKAKQAAPAASIAGMGAGMNPDKMKMHEEMHKPGGMHEQMHGKDGKMMGGQMKGGDMGAMPPASAASK